MADKDKESKRQQPGSGGGLYKSMGRFVITTMTMAVVLFAFLFFAVRTDAVRQWIVRTLEARTGLELQIGNSRMVFPPALVLENIKSAVDDAIPGGSIVIGEARVGVGITGLFSIRISDARIELNKLEDKTWTPACLASFGNLKQVEDIAGLTESFRKRVSIEFRDSTISWIGADGTKIAYADGLDFSLEPVKVGRKDRKLYYCFLSIYDVLDLDGNRAREVTREWFFTEASDVIDIDYREGRKAEPDEDEEDRGKRHAD